jgi:hypothetical protein
MKKNHQDGLPPIESEAAKKMRLRLEASREWLKDYQARRREQAHQAASEAAES